MTRRFSRTSSNRSDGSSNYSAPSSSSGSDSEPWQWQWQPQQPQHDQYSQSPSGYGYESYESEQQGWDPLVAWQQQQHYAPAGITAKKYKPYRPPPDQYPLHIAPIEQEVQMPPEDEWEEEGWQVWPVEVLGLRVTELAESDAGYSPPLPPHRIAPTPPRLATPAPGPGAGRRRSSVARMPVAAPVQQPPPPPPEEHHHYNLEEVEAPLVGGASRRRQQQQQPRSSTGPGAADKPIRFGEVKWGEAPAQEKREELGGGGSGEKTTTMHRCRFQALSMARTVLARGG